MVSKKILTDLPNKQDLVKLMQSLAVLDAVICPEWDMRYSLFDSKWGKCEMLATMRNGSGDEYFIYFNEYGVIIKGFDHESEMSPFANDEMKIWAGVVDDVPSEFLDFLQDEAFPPEYTTFCLWRLDSNAEWKTGKIEYPENEEDADGSNWLLFLLDGLPETYSDWAESYYEQNINLEVVESIYSYEPLTEEMIKKLNPERDFIALKKDVSGIGYPLA